MGFLQRDGNKVFIPFEPKTFTETIDVSKERVQAAVRGDACFYNVADDLSCAELAVQQSKISACFGSK